MDVGNWGNFSGLPCWEVSLRYGFEICDCMLTTVSRLRRFPVALGDERNIAD
jgi:hypothetical protein